MALVNGWKLLTYITKSSIFDVTGVLDTPPTSTSQIIMEKIFKNYVISRNRQVQSGIRLKWHFYKYKEIFFLDYEESY